MNAPFRLTPTMRSRKLLALDFIRQFWAKHNYSPSFSEIGAALGDIPNSSVLAIVRRLHAEQLIDYRGGGRSIVLPCARSEALRVLLEAGYTIVVGAQTLTPPQGHGRTNEILSAEPELVHIPDIAGGVDQDDDDNYRRRGAVG